MADSHYRRWVDSHGPGTVREHETGSRRDTRQGKGRFDLLPPAALRRVAQHFEAGANKYGDRNWEKGQPLSWYLDSGCRHWAQLLSGETDEDHAAAWAWNALAFLETQERIRRGLLPGDLDDLPSLNNWVESECPSP